LHQLVGEKLLLRLFVGKTGRGYLQQGPLGNVVDVLTSFPPKQVPLGGNRPGTQQDVQGITDVVEPNRLAVSNTRQRLTEIFTLSSRDICRTYRKMNVLHIIED
jgi:hypothetical protein